MKTLLLCLVALSALGQSKQLIVGQDVKPVAFGINGYYLFSGKQIRIVNTTDLQVKPGSTGSIDMTDTTKMYLFLPSEGARVLNYSVPGGTTPIPKPDSVSVDNQPGQPGLVYSATGWTNAGNSCCGWYSNTLSYNSTIGATITYTFVGNKLVWYSEHAANKGRAAVQVDNGLITTVTLTGAGGVDNVTKKPSYIWKGTQGSHTVKVTALGGGDLAHDKFVYHTLK